MSKTECKQRREGQRMPVVRGPYVLYQIPDNYERNSRIKRDEKQYCPAERTVELDPRLQAFLSMFFLPRVFPF